MEYPPWATLTRACTAYWLQAAAAALVLNSLMYITGGLTDVDDQVSPLYFDAFNLTQIIDLAPLANATPGAPVPAVVPSASGAVADSSEGVFSHTIVAAAWSQNASAVAAMAGLLFGGATLVDGQVRC